MRSSKNRSRSKSNRNRSMGNVANRVFDSSGPEGKVRGTPQQIIDKYNQLTRDAQLSNDLVAAENFQQHAEHYLRMLGEAQREQEARREHQQNAQNGTQGRDNGARAAPNSDDVENTPQNGQSDDSTQALDVQATHPSAKPFDAVIDAGAGGQTGLIETPEDVQKSKRAQGGRRRRSNGNADSSDKIEDMMALPLQSDQADLPPKEAAE